MNRFLEKFFSLLSFSALDAPLATTCWWATMIKISDLPFDKTTINIGLSLGLAVWTIYLFDRIHDYRTTRDPPNQPERKKFTARHPRLFYCLFAFSLLATITSAVTLQAKILIQASIIALITGGYFLICKYQHRESRIPVKELLIGLCFATGIGLPYSINHDPPAKYLLLAIILILATVNCLIISRAESGFDSKNDPSAYFAQNGRSFPIRPTLIIAIILSAVCIFAFLEWAAIASTISAFLLYLCDKQNHAWRETIQPRCDAALWFPALILLLL